MSAPDKIWACPNAREDWNGGYWDLAQDNQGPEGEYLLSTPAREHAQELVEALASVTASLVAATSLLNAGGKSAAASDKMFSVMLDDYGKSVDEARALLAKVKENGE